MSNYVYEEKLIPFNIRDMGYAISTVKQGIPGTAPSTGTSTALTGLLIVIDKSLWDAFKGKLSGSEFTINIKGIDSSNVSQGLTFSSITCVFGEEYENIDYVTLYGKFDNVTLSSIPTQNTKIELIYLPSNTTFTKDNIACRTAGGRVMGRHVNWEGSVINFDQYGTRTNLYIPDAKFRDLGDYSISNKIISTDTQMHSPIFDISTENHMSAKYVYLIADGRKEDDDYFTNTEYLTDTQLQSKIDSLLNNAQSFANDFTAKEGTDAILALDSNSKAANYVRSVIPSKLTPCNIPNFYELCVLYLESDNIDLLDYDIRYTPNFPAGRRLGAPARFNGRAIEKQSCTEVSIIGSSGSQSFEGLHLNNGGLSRMYGRYTTIGVIPVLEL